MSEKKELKGWKKLCADMKPMTFEQKVDHLWTYYKEWLIIGFLLVVSVCAMVTSIKNTSKEVILNGMLVNISISQQGVDYLGVEYMEAVGGNPDKQKVELDYTNFENLADPTNAEDNYSKSMLLIARVTGGMMDYAILDKMGLEFYLTQDVFRDLREFFTAEEMAALEPYLIYAQVEGEPDRWPMAVDITHLPFVQDTMEQEEQVFFTLSGNVRSEEACRSIWEYINAWE